MLRITRRFTFQMAHALYGYGGLCSNMHGHSYELHVTVAGEPDDDGMVMDFNRLKEIVQENVLDYYDHSLLLKADYESKLAEEIAGTWNNVHIVGFQPTSENIISDIVQRLEDALPSDVELFSLRLRETENNWTEWFAYDNI